MTNSRRAILIVDASAKTRARLASELASTGCRVLEAEDGVQALEIVRQGRVRLVVSDLFLRTAESDCLIQAVRQNRVHGTRVLAHTVRGRTADREWAKRWGASGFLIQPTATERLRYVVGKLLTMPGRTTTGTVRTSRRDTLGGALAEIERGDLGGMSSIVVGRSWWNGLTGSVRNEYRRRARRTGVSLRSDAMMSSHFVELRGVAHPKGKTESAGKSTPYRR